MVNLVPKLEEKLLKLNLGLVRVFKPKSSTTISGNSSS